MTFQKNLLGLVVPEPCISRTSVAAETPAAAVRNARRDERDRGGSAGHDDRPGGSVREGGGS